MTHGCLRNVTSELGGLDADMSLCEMEGKRKTGGAAPLTRSSFYIPAAQLFFQAQLWRGSVLNWSADLDSAHTLRSHHPLHSSARLSYSYFIQIPTPRYTHQNLDTVALLAPPADAESCSGALRRHVDILRPSHNDCSASVIAHCAG